MGIVITRPGHHRTEPTYAAGHNTETPKYVLKAQLTEQVHTTFTSISHLFSAFPVFQAKFAFFYLIYEGNSISYKSKLRPTFFN